MKRSASICLGSLLTASASAGTSDPAGIAQGILYLFIGAFVLWVGFSVLVARASSRHTHGRVLVAVCIAVAPLAYCSYQSHSYESGLRELAEVNRAIRDQAEAYMLEKCRTERLATASHLLMATDGVFVEANDDMPLKIPNVPSPVPRTVKTALQEQRYGRSYPHATNDYQYVKPLHWANQVFADSILSESGLAYVELRKRHNNRGDAYERIATMKWWAEHTPHLEFAERLREAGRSFDARYLLYPLNLSLREVTAQYIIRFEDISTLEDRKHWVARGRISMLRRADESTVAEYVGFAANRSPVSFGDGYAWESVSVCPGSERQYMDDRLGRWNAIRFFFKELVHIDGAVPAAGLSGSFTSASGVP
ncbi:MAG: hypothetical protein K2Y28_08995 [Burkholderiaceae bacterium]|nr:hypothetical protein [Burkholderiaceae bacterium]